MFCLEEEKWHNFIEKHFNEIRASFSAGIELLPDCNFRCIHCYAESDRQSADKNLTTDQIFSIIDDLVYHGCLFVFFTGGDPLLHKDFAEIYKYARTSGLFVSILTNGTLLNKRHIELWTEYPPDKISMTMYGASEETYQRVTGVKGMYSRFCNSVKLLHDNQIPFEIKCVGMKQNYDDILLIRDFARSYNLKYQTLGWSIHTMNNGDKTPLNCRLTPEQAFRIELSDPERKYFWDHLAVDKTAFALTEKQKKNLLYPCSIARQFVFITYNGHMQGCVLSTKPYYDLTKGNFDEGWEFLRKEFVEKIASPNFKCASCSKLHYCGQCSAIAKSENGSAEIPVDFFCKYGELLENYMLGRVSREI